MTMPSDDQELPPNDDGDEPVPARVSAPVKRIGRPPPKGKSGVGAGPDGERRPREAEILWPWLLENVVKPAGASAWDVRIQVSQIDPPIPGGISPVLGYIQGGAVEGSDQMTAGDALVNRITDGFHINRAVSRGSVKYAVRFLWAQNSQQFAIGDLALMPRDEIMAIRHSADRFRRGDGGAAVGAGMDGMGMGGGISGTNPGMGAPTGPTGMGSPMGMGMGFGASDHMPMVMQMMQEMWRAGQEQRQPAFNLMQILELAKGLAAPPVAVPPPIDEAKLAERVTTTVIMALKQMGVLDRPAPAAAPATTGVAAPATAIVQAPKSKMEMMFDRMMDVALAQFQHGVETKVKEVMTGLGAPPAPQEEVEEEPTGPDAIPFNVTALPDARWRDGRPINYVTDKESGEIDWKGVVFANPVIAETMMQAASGALGAVGEMVKKVASNVGGAVGTAVGGMAGPVGAPPQMGVGAPPLPQGPPAQPEIVAATPPSAVDAGGGGEEDWRK